MDTNKIERLARNKHRGLVEKRNARNNTLSDLNNQIKDLYKSLHDISDFKAQHTLKQLIKEVKHKKQSILKLQTHFNDEKYIVITNWSENDLYDSNNQLISNQDLNSWKTVGCKVYGKGFPDPNAENAQDNTGYFAQFNYPINIVHNPETFYFSKDELPSLYDSIASHNPKLKNVLVKIAKSGTIQVGTFKSLFGLTENQLKEKIKKAKFDQQNNIPNFTVSQLEKYYQWELKYRREYEPNGDYSAYDSDQDDASDFNTALNNYHETGVDSDDPSHYDDDNLDGWWVDYNQDDGEEYNDEPYYSQWSDRESDGYSDFGLNGTNNPDNITSDDPSDDE